MHPGGYPAQGGSTIHDVFSGRITEGALALCRSIREMDADASRDAARSLIGLGLGLTPSGDDVLAAAMAAATFCTLAFGCLEEPGMSFKQAILSIVDGSTTPFSMAFLSDAARGEVVRPLGCLLGEILCGEEPERIWTYERELLRIGATSGRDMLFGAVQATRSFLALANSLAPSSEGETMEERRRCRVRD
ncbi:MAG: DUF2877 domain-containing protein [Desulfobacterales bacterium]|nr:DUF2877 domain-containing protein [Desulfobacterales bacterium]